MAKLPKMARIKHTVNQRIEDALVAERESEAGKRPLRLSGIGKCPRALWAAVQGRQDERPPGPQALATFKMGHYIEPGMVDLLRLAGFNVKEVDDDGKQFSVSMFDGSVYGHIDGMILWGSGAAREWKLLEVKTAKDKRFELLREAGSYCDWNPEYGAQLQGYMGASQEPHSKVEPMNDSLVVVVNKDTSERWIEAVRFDCDQYAALKESALIAMGDEMPERPAKANGQYSKFCKWCSVAAWCYSPMAGVEFDA